MDIFTHFFLNYYYYYFVINHFDIYIYEWMKLIFIDLLVYILQYGQSTRFLIKVTPEFTQ